MAVVQISKIQVRRGQKNQGSGLPQLASGEFGWAVDTRELFIGNGSVAEGAPAVGNTKVLTQYDDLFSLADTYTYRGEDLQTGIDISQPVTLALQSRLDERVSVKAFDAQGDSSTDDTAAIQRAIDQLYLISTTPVQLFFPAGTYRISDTLYIPPNAYLVGEGIGRTKILQTDDGTTVMQTVNSSSTPGNPAADSSSSTLNQASNIVIDNMTIEVESAAKVIVLQSCKDSKFKNIEIKGPWVQTDAPSATDVAIEINQLSGPVASDNNVFDNCIIEGFSYGLVSNWDIDNNTWQNCKFNILAYGVLFGNDMSLGSEASGTSRGPSNGQFLNNQFTNINKNAIKITNGFKNIIERCSFESVANEAGGETQPQYPIIVVSKKTNKVLDCYFSRTENLALGSGITNIPYYPEVEGPAMFDLIFENSSNFGPSTNVRLFRLPGISNKGYEIDYTLVSSSYQAARSGKLNIVVNSYTNEVEVSDNYNYVGDPLYAESIGFTGALMDADTDAEFDTIDIRVNSTMPPSDQTEIKYVVRTKNTDIG